MAIELETPRLKMGWSLCRRAVWANWRSRKAGARTEDVDYLDAQDKVGVLSVAQTRVAGVVQEQVAAMLAPVTRVASSKSLLVSGPVGLMADAKAR